LARGGAAPHFNHVVALYNALGVVARVTEPL